MLLFIDPCKSLPGTLPLANQLTSLSLSTNRPWRTWECGIMQQLVDVSRNRAGPAPLLVQWQGDPTREGVVFGYVSPRMCTTYVPCLQLSRRGHLPRGNSRDEMDSMGPAGSTITLIGWMDASCSISAFRLEAAVMILCISANSVNRAGIRHDDYDPS